VTKSVFSVTSLKKTFRLLIRRNKKGGITMKSLIFLVCALLFTGCSYQHAKSHEDRMGKCKEGYQMALRSGIRDLTENVIFQIVLKRMNGHLGDTNQLEAELSQLVMVCEDESTRKKAELALRFLNNMSKFNIANIRADYYDENKMFYLLEEYLNVNTPEYTQVK
jgi:hypothetical protein